jgi:AraC-like DNA-binding protein
MTLNLRESGAQVEIKLAAIYEHAAGWAWKRPMADHFNLWLALEGQGVFGDAGRTWPFAAGSVFLFPPGVCPTGRLTGGFRMINFSAHIKARGKAAAALGALAREASPARLRNFIWASHLCRHLSEAFYMGSAEGRDLVLSGLDLLLRSMCYERALPPADPAGDALMRIVERIRRNPAAAYGVAEMAASAKLSDAQFTRRFKALTGLTPNRFIVEERLARAESYLRETDMGVQEIASRLGYRDVYFFSRQFRRFRGLPPSGVRQRPAHGSGGSS